MRKTEWVPGLSLFSKNVIHSVLYLNKNALQVWRKMITSHLFYKNHDETPIPVVHELEKTEKTMELITLKIFDLTYKHIN